MPGSSVTVIGAGVVGLCCARWLQRSGYEVTVIDPVAPGESCSFGNAGIISKTSVVPLAMPGIIAKVPGWLIDPPWVRWRCGGPISHGRRLFPGLRGGKVSQWMGCRPSLPDSLPVIGRSPYFEKLFYAFGHGHRGLAEGAITGKLIAELIAGSPTSIDITPYRIDRF